MKLPVENHRFLSSGVRLVLLFSCLNCISSQAWAFAGQTAPPAQLSTSPSSTSPSAARPPKAHNSRARSAGASSSAPAPVAQPPAVLLKQGTLEVEANNSDLSQILRQVAAAGGMTIDGVIPTARVYGTYGPGSSRAVLTDLLTGLDCNFMMIGSTHEGVPSKLLLTARTSQPPSPSTSTPPAPTTAADEDKPGPGAIVNVPPAGPDDPQERARQNLNRLQQMHDQQMKPLQPQ